MKLSHFAIVASTLTAASAYQARSRDECNDFRIVCGFGGHIGADQYTAAADKIPTEGSVGSHAEYFYASGDSGDLIEVISSHGGANPTYEEVKRSADCTATFCDNGDGTGEWNSFNKKKAHPKHSFWLRYHV